MKIHITKSFIITCPVCLTKQTGFISEIKKDNMPPVRGWQCVVKHCLVTLNPNDVMSRIELSVGEIEL